MTNKSLISDDVESDSLTSTYEHFDPIDEDRQISPIRPEINTEKHRLHKDISIDSQCSSHGSVRRSHSPELHKYEEFSNKIKLQCPTCKGKGKLTQGQADSMVALIPVRDKRLKPRKTKLYLGITFVVCMIVTFLVTFFLLPRSVSIEIIGTDTKHIYMPDSLKTVPYIDVAVTFSIKNDNFFKADISNIKQDISWNRFILNSSVLDGNKPFQVNGRTQQNHTILTRQIFQGDVNIKVKRVCAFGWNWSLLEMFVNTATVSYLYRSEQISDTNYEYVICMNQTAYTMSGRKRRSNTSLQPLNL